MATYQVPGGLILASVLTVIVSGFVPEPSVSVVLPQLDRFAILIVTTAIFLGVCVIVYTNANALHAPRIDQLTPRYMLPLVAPLLIGILPSRWRRFERAPTHVFIAVGAALLVVLLLVGRELQLFQFTGAVLI